MTLIFFVFFLSRGQNQVNLDLSDGVMETNKINVIIVVVIVTLLQK